MAKIFVSFYNFCKIADDYTAMPPFFESFFHGLKDSGNEVLCFQTKCTTNRGFDKEMPKQYAEMLRDFNPDLCILFNNNFWDISNFVDCPIVIYDVDSPLEFQLKEKISENVERYKFVYNQTAMLDTLKELYNVSEAQCRYIPFFTGIESNPEAETTTNIVFVGTNWLWKGYDFLGNFMKGPVTRSDVKKAAEVIEAFTKYPFNPSHEIYYQLKNCPHNRINLGDLRRCSIEISGYRRLKFLSAVADLGLDIYGSFWHIDAMNYFPEVLQCVRNEQKWTKAQNEMLYNSARIAFNTKHIQAQNGFSFRVCDILASNACLVSERCNDFDTLFPDVHIPQFESPSEARELCLKLLNNENQRLEIVEAAHEAIEKDFRFKNVLDHLEDFLGMTLHSDGDGTLQILAPWDYSVYLKGMKAAVPVVKPAAVPAVKPAARPKTLSPAKQFYYNTIGKHLGYDPYDHFQKKIIYFGKIPMFKILQTTANRKEIYMGFFPIVSYNNERGRSVIHNLLLEKACRMFHKIAEKHKKKPITSAKPAPAPVSEPMSISLPLVKNRARLTLMKNKLENGEKIRIVLFVSRINCWVFGRLYSLMEQSDVFEPVIVVKPFMSRGHDHMVECMESTYEALVEQGYHPIKGYDKETDTFFDVRNELDPDIVFYTKFWKPHFHPYYYFNNFRDRLTLLIDYGYNITGHSEAMNFEMQNGVDMYFYFSPMQKDIAARYMRNKAKNVVISGSLKLDDIFDRSYIPKDVWKPQDKPKKRIIWAPHHEDKTPNHMYQFDAFYDLYDIMFEIAEKYKDEIQIAFKPHPLLKVRLNQYWGEEAVEEYYKKWEDLENGQLEEGAFMDLFLTSDAMILDSLSFIAEYTAVNKPALFTIGTHSRVKLNDMGWEIYDMMYHAEAEHMKQQVCDFIEDVVINANDVYMEKRTKYIQEKIAPPNDKSAAENVFDLIVDYIKCGSIPGTYAEQKQEDER